MVTNTISTLVSPIYTSSLAGNIINYTPSQGTNRENYFNCINYEDKRYRLWREVNTFPAISSFSGCVLSVFRRKNTSPLRQKRTSKCFFRTNAKDEIIQKRSNICHNRKMILIRRIVIPIIIICLITSISSKNHVSCSKSIFHHHFRPFWTGTTVLFLVSTKPFRKGSVFACSTACSSADLEVKVGEDGIIP